MRVDRMIALLFWVKTLKEPLSIDSFPDRIHSATETRGFSLISFRFFYSCLSVSRRDSFGNLTPFTP